MRNPPILPTQQQPATVITTDGFRKRLLGLLCWLFQISRSASLRSGPLSTKNSLPKYHNASQRIATVVGQVSYVLLLLLLSSSPSLLTSSNPVTPSERPRVVVLLPLAEIAVALHPFMVPGPDRLTAPRCRHRQGRVLAAPSRPPRKPIRALIGLPYSATAIVLRTAGAGRGEAFQLRCVVSFACYFYICVRLCVRVAKTIGENVWGQATRSASEQA